MQICIKCQEELREGAKFCDHCGEKVEQKLVCTQCQSDLREGARFCDVCGSKVGEEVQLSPTIPRPVPVKSLCLQCGEELSENVKFCDLCGAKVEVATAKTEKTADVPEQTPKVPEKVEGPLKKICPKCQKVLEPSIKFCDVCGSDIREVMAVAVSEEQGK